MCDQQVLGKPPKKFLYQIKGLSRFKLRKSGKSWAPPIYYFGRNRSNLNFEAILEVKEAVSAHNFWVLLVIFDRSFKKYFKSSPQLAEVSLFLFVAGGRRRRRGRRRRGGNTEEEPGVPVPSRPAALGTRRNCQFYLHSSWLRAASHPLAGKPVDWPRSARPIQKSIHFFKKKWAKCAAKGSRPPPWAIGESLYCLGFPKLYPPWGGVNTKKEFWGYPQGPWGGPCQIWLRSIQWIGLQIRTNKQTDRPLLYICRFPPIEEGRFYTNIWMGLFPQVEPLTWNN